MTFAQWEIDGFNQAVIEVKKRIKGNAGYWWNWYRRETGDVDYSEADHGMGPQGSRWDG